jgi:hypothetical protein
MDDRASVIAQIKKGLSGRFRVLDNTGAEKRVVAGQFPDVILMRPEPPPNSDTLFVMKVEVGTTNLIDSIPEWKALGSTPSVLYIVVPEHKLDEAKKLASATSVRARFASYKVENNQVEEIRYE